MNLNETERLLLYIIAFATGWGIAYIFKNLGSIWRKLGALFGFVLVPPAIMMLMLLSEMVRVENNLLLSCTLAAGFFVRLLKRD